MTWKLKDMIGPDGSKIVVIDEPSNDTCSFVQIELPQLTDEARRAAGAIRQMQTLNRNDLRNLFPRLAARCSDRHLDDVINCRGKIAPQKWAAGVLADLSGCSPETILRYSRMNGSRQGKKAGRGRPSK